MRNLGRRFENTVRVELHMQSHRVGRLIAEADQADCQSAAGCQPAPQLLPDRVPYKPSAAHTSVLQ